MAKSRQSELHPDDGIDLASLILTCGTCGETLARGDWTVAGFEGQRYTVYVYTCPTPECARIELSVPRIDQGSRQRALSEVTVTSLELKSETYLEPVRRERHDQRMRLDYARGHDQPIEVVVDVPATG